MLEFVGVRELRKTTNEAMWAGGTPMTNVAKALAPENTKLATSEGVDGLKMVRMVCCTLLEVISSWTG